MLGRGCASNAPAGTHFSTVKQFLLQGKLHLWRMDFLSAVHGSTMVRLTAGELELPQTARCRKSTKAKDSDALQIDPWLRKG
jgi:hypothetical protein